MAVALATLPALVAVAAAQPVVVVRNEITQRADVQALFVLDTSLSMSARRAPGAPTRLERAERDVEALLPRLGDIPVGLATMTDRVLPNLMPTTNDALIRKTLNEAIGINEPPPSRPYIGEATNFSSALLPLSQEHLFPPRIRHRFLVVFTDGESKPLPTNYGAAIAGQLTIPPLFVHIWAPDERIYIHGRAAPQYRPDPQSTAVLEQFARATHGEVFNENDLDGLVRTIKAEAGPARRDTTILGYERVALGPWFLLGGVFPLGFLFWRRNL